MSVHEILENYKELQSGCNCWLPHCPRCGKYAMRYPITTNALSRRADIYICDNCGMTEAIDDFLGKPTLLSEWALFKNPTMLQITLKQKGCEM